MKKTVILTFAILFINQLFGQDFYSNFIQYQNSNDTLNQLKTLITWEKTKPTDAELYTSYFNYYFDKSQKELLSLTTEQPQGDVIEIKDSANKIAGYLGSRIEYSMVDFKKGIEWLDKGISMYPNRLDMRFGKIYAFGKTKDWDSFTKEIIATIQYSKINNNNWTWTKNEKQKDGEEFFLSALQDYQLQLYNTEDDKLLVNMANIANEILKLYPNHIESLSNLSITYILAKDYDKALVALLKAEKIKPKDCIVLLNIAHCYKKKGEKAKLIEYCEKVIKYGNAEAKEVAQKQIEELKK